MNQEPLPGEVILVDKPLGWTSFQAVKKVKWIKKARKAGHAGTLDPLASGLLIICTERSTRKISGIQDAEKEYTGTITLGAVTPSYDLETDPQDFRDYAFVTAELLEQTARLFTGEIMQAPPLFSAIKVEGKRAYKLAREGVSHELEKRPVMITELEFTQVRLPEVDFRVVCGKGTYIRSLAHDIGRQLGCGAYLSALRRTRIGTYLVSEAQTPQEMEKSKNTGNGGGPEIV